MLKKVKIAFSLLMVTLVLCSCNSGGTNSDNSKAAQKENTVSYEAFIKDNIMYIRDDKGNAYEYNDGFYTDDSTGEEYVYVPYYDLYYFGSFPEIQQEHNLPEDEEKRNDAISALGEDEEKSQMGYKIPSGYLDFDSSTARYYGEEDMFGNKIYIPENEDGTYDEQLVNKDGTYGDKVHFIFAKDGTRITFNSIEDITE